MKLEYDLCPTTEPETDVNPLSGAEPKGVIAMTHEAYWKLFEQSVSLTREQRAANDVLFLVMQFAKDLAEIDRTISLTEHEYLATLIRALEQDDHLAAIREALESIRGAISTAPPSELVGMVIPIWGNLRTGSLVFRFLATIARDAIKDDPKTPNR